jgi:short-subunit dehydrogenase
MVTPNRTALVTGAAVGLGASFAELLARQGHNLVLVDRQADRLQERAADLGARHGVKVHAIVQALQDPGAASRILAECERLGAPIDVLVNNAGFHLNKLFHQHPWSEIDANVRVLLNVVVELTHRFLPGMIERRWGRILNVSSVSGFMPGGVRIATYNATKNFLIPFTEGLNLELEGTGVSATAVCPGFTKTDFYVANGLTDVRDSVASFMWLDPARVAEGALRASMRQTPVYVSGIPNRLIVTAAKFVPRKLLRDRTRIFHRKAHDEMDAAMHTNGGAGGVRRAALVTGSSAGIGWSFAELLAGKGFDIILVARREQLLKDRAAELARRHGVRTHAIVQDLADPAAPDRLRSECDSLGWPVDVLVNNAGYPVNELFHRMSWEQINAALQVLVVSVVHTTHSFMGGMISRGWGRIINVASMAGFEPGSYRSSLYSSSKSFVIAFSESVDSELEGTGVRVTALCPGFTKTEWTSKNNLKNGSVPGIFWMESDAVAQVGFDDATKGTPLAIATRPAQRLLTTMFQLAPRRYVGRFLSNKRRSMVG